MRRPHGSEIHRFNFGKIGPAVAPRWTTFECPNCGEVEDIDMAATTKFKCQRCGADMDMIDGTETITEKLEK